MKDAKSFSDQTYHRHAHNVLFSTARKIRQITLNGAPESLLESPVSNFWTSVPGKLYRGAQPTPEGLKWLKSQGVKTIVSFRENGVEERTGYPNYTKTDEKNITEQLGMRFVDLGFKDKTTPNSAALVEDFKKLFNDPDAGPIFIHCAAGIGRTGIFAAIGQKEAGLPKSRILYEAQRGGLDPERWDDHANQFQFIKNQLLPKDAFRVRPSLYENDLMKRLLVGKGVVMNHGPHDTNKAKENLQDAIKRGISFEMDGNLVTRRGKPSVVNAHHPWSYWAHSKRFPFAKNIADNHPQRYLDIIAEAKANPFIKYDFKSPNVVEAFTDLSQQTPETRKMGHAFLRELAFSPSTMPFWTKQELLSLADLKRARNRLGEGAPFLVSCTGLNEKTLTPELAERIAKVAKGRAECINFNLAGGKSPSVEIVKMVWEKYRLVCEIKIKSQKDKDFWEAQNLPYLGVTDHPDLATAF